MPLSDYINAEQPLGPIRHDVFHDDLKSASELTFNLGPFERVFAERSCMIIGRKGSGKSSVVQGYRTLAQYGRSYGKIDEEAPRNGDYKIAISSWGQFHEMVRNVANRAASEIIAPGEEDLIWSERLAEIWADTFWDLIFQSLYQSYTRSTKLRAEIPSIIELFESEDITMSGANSYVQTVESTYKKAKQEAINYFGSNKRTCYILIDSMEEYPVRSRLFLRVVSGFLKCVNDFSYAYKCVRIIFCLPAEIREIISRRSVNLVKDFGGGAVLNWQPSDLLRMVAERYRTGLLTISDDLEEKYEKKLLSFDFSSREDLQAFFSDVMEHELVNGFDQPEDTLAYIIRHTQLLPREFILIFNRAIKKSKEDKGSWRYITADAVRWAVEETETDLARHLLHPYDKIYPQLLQACESVMPELPPICSMSDLDRVGSRFKNRIEDDIYDPWKVLFDIGILGYVEDISPGQHAESDRYVYGYFSYNSNSPIAFRNDAQYCVHPLFSRLWSLKRSAVAEMRCVYPANIEHFRAKS